MKDWKNKESIAEENLNMTDFVKSIYKKIEHLERDYRVPMKTQISYLDKQNKPRNDMERSYLQYKCQRILMPRLSKLLYNCLSWPAIIILPLVFLAKSYRYKCESSFDAVFVENGMDMSVIPQELRDNYKAIVDTNINADKCLDLYSFLELEKLIFQHPFCPYFNVKICMKIALYCACIRKYNPKAIITYCETSFASAVSTGYLETKGIKHINIQHGDFLKSIRFSGFRFSEFYVWHEHYSKMFKSLWNTDTHYVIAIPESVTKACDSNGCAEIKYYLTYYLGDESPETLHKIADNLICLIRAGHNCKVRLHPRESDLREIRQIFKNIKLEDPRKVLLADSINESKYVCALNSTVLFQASFCGHDIVIDDLSNHKEYKRLRECEYILLNNPHILMSQLLYK